jgi:hypothetical protein
MYNLFRHRIIPGLNGMAKVGRYCAPINAIAYKILPDLQSSGHTVAKM